MCRDFSFIRSGNFFYIDFFYKFGVNDEVVRVGDLVGGRKIYIIFLEFVKIDTNKMFIIIVFRIWIYKSIVVMFRIKRY